MSEGGLQAAWNSLHEARSAVKAEARWPPPQGLRFANRLSWARISDETPLKTTRADGSGLIRE